MITEDEKDSIASLGTPARLNTANGEAVASKRLKVPLRWSTPTDALVMKGCCNILLLVRRFLEQGFSLEWEAGPKPALTSPNGETLELEVENCAPRVYRRCPVIFDVGGCC